MQITSKIMPMLRKHKRTLPLTTFAILGVIAMMLLMNVPGGVPSISATFSTPTYSDTRISSVNVWGNGSTALQAWSYSSNPDAVPDMAIGTYITKFQVQVAVKTSRLAPGGVMLDHIAVSGSITTPAGVVTALTEANGELGGYALGTADGIYYHVFEWEDMAYTLSEVGVYRLSFTMSIEVP